MSHLGDDPKALVTVINGLGGTIVDNDTFSFPVHSVTEAVPKLLALGVECKIIREYVGRNPRSGKTENVAEFVAYKR